MSPSKSKSGDVNLIQSFKCLFNLFYFVACWTFWHLLASNYSLHVCLMELLTTQRCVKYDSGPQIIPEGITGQTGLDLLFLFFLSFFVCLSVCLNEWMIYAQGGIKRNIFAYYGSHKSMNNSEDQAFTSLSKNLWPSQMKGFNLPWEMTWWNYPLNVLELACTSDNMNWQWLVMSKWTQTRTTVIFLSFSWTCSLN